MTQQLDPRILRIGVEINGKLHVYEDAYMKASITKYANPLQNECTVQLDNLSRNVRDFLLTETSPYNGNRTPKRLIVEAGRVSTGAFRLYTGDITEAIIGQPPDISLTLKSKTGQYAKGDIVSATAAGQTRLSAIARNVARDLALSLVFEALDKNINNYSFTGAALKQVEKLAQAGNVNAYIDDTALIVKDYNKALKQTTHVLSKDSGMVGVPMPTEQGVKVTYMLDPQSQLGGRITIQSDLNKAMSGDYVIYKLSYDLANRDTPFYCIAEAKREGSK